MKRIFIILVAAVMLTVSLSVCISAGQYINSSSAPIIDGSVDDIWYEQPVYYVDVPLSGNTPVAADFRMAWNNTIVYLLVRVFDTDISSTGTYEDRDGVTFWINPSDKRDGDIFKIMITAPANSGISVSGPGNDYSSFERSAKKAYVKTDYGYMIEASFELSALYSGFTAVSGTSIGFDIWITDQGDDTKNLLSWSGYDGTEGYVLKDTVSFMTASVPDSEGQGGADDNIPGTTDTNGFYYLWAIVAFIGMVVAYGWAKKEEA